MKYPSVYLMGERAHGEVLSIAFAGNGQHQDAGAKIVHAAPNTTSNIFAKSISKDGGARPTAACSRSPRARRAPSPRSAATRSCSTSGAGRTRPTIRIGEDDVNVGHEASVSKIGEEQLFYLMAAGSPRTRRRS